MLEIQLSLLNDDELVGFIEKHNYRAFKELVVRYAGDLFFFSYYFTFDDSISSDICQTVFGNIWQKPYRYLKNFRTKIYKNTLKLSIKNAKNIKEIKNISRKELSCLILYYFSTLKPREIEAITPNFENVKDALEHNFREQHNFELFEFLKSYSPINIDISSLQNSIVVNITKLPQVNKYQTYIIVIAIIPILALIFLLLYSVIYTERKYIAEEMEMIENLHYYFVN